MDNYSRSYHCYENENNHNVSNYKKDNLNNLNNEQIINKCLNNEYIMSEKLATLKKEGNVSIITLDDGKANVFSSQMSQDVKHRIFMSSKLYIIYTSQLMKF